MLILEKYTLEFKGQIFVPWRRMLHPKLSWVIQQLDSYGIAHMTKRRTDEDGSNATTMLYVAQGAIEICDEIMQTPVNVPSMSLPPDELPDSHPFFEREEPESTVPAEYQEVVEAAEEIPVETGTEDEDGDDDSWGFDDDEDEEGPIIDVEARVVEDDEFEADDPAPPSPKVKKEKPQPQEAVDPEFENAEDPKPTTKLSGTEFTQVDEVLAYQDIMFPGNTEPVRMYDVNSSNVSAIGSKPIKDKPLVVTFYIRYKSNGDITYRYNPVPTIDANEAFNLAVRRAAGIQEASVGSFCYHTIRDPAEAGLIKCQRTQSNTDGSTTWVKVIPKKERVKATKERAKQ